MSDNKKPPHNDKSETQANANNAKQDSKPDATELNNQDNQASKSQPAQNQSAQADPLFDPKILPKMQAPAKTGTAKGRTLGFILLGLLLLLTMAVAVYTLYQNQQVQQAWQSAKTDASQQIQTLRQQVNQAQNQLQTQQQFNQSAQQELAKQQQALLQLNQALTATQQKVRILSGRQKQDWLLAEAEYLIRLAEFKLTLEKDIVSALALLKTADQRIVTMADNSLLELRQALATDMSYLNALEQPDLSGIAAQLIALSQQIPKLQLIALEFEQPSKTNQKITETASAETKSQGFSFASIYDNFLADFITIKDHSQPLKPLMSVSQRSHLNANIELALQLAQRALFNSDTLLYQHHLSQAVEWINEYFIFNAEAKAVVASLNQLAEQSIVIATNKPLSTSKTIKSINQQRLYQWLDQKQPSETIETDSAQGDQL
jgi:uncharacterized protein HemX